jgi:hypothetical protein
MSVVISLKREGPGRIIESDGAADYIQLSGLAPAWLFYLT